MNGLLRAKLQRAFDAGVLAYQSGRWQGQNPFDKQADQLSIEWQFGVLTAMQAKGAGTKFKPQRLVGVQLARSKHGPVRHLNAS